MSNDLAFSTLILEASFVVQLVMLLLLVASVASWYLIFVKRRTINQAETGADAFEDRFWSGGNLAEIYTQVNAPHEETGGLERIFRAGFREFSRMRKQTGASAESIVEASHRAMRVSMSREMDRLERYIPFLATVGSTSPYVGLFGTVWGIMNAFRALGQMQQATLTTVAPGIAEALIATALGLFAAIPAVIAYNRYASQVERISNRYDIFMEEFTSILQRHAHTQPSASAQQAGA
ncbi:protein TolQ [Ectothiorhodospiraceae bacterium WFHF3C12]|nr:protein TolQ [Ectothiorhodospiraceae bacterium WFHF3C12]